VLEGRLEALSIAVICIGNLADFTGVPVEELPFILEVMARAGHRSMATTRQYLHLAGVVFPERAAALEDRLPSGRTFYPTEPISPDPSESEAALQAATDAA
jgi:hypothetical protein